MTQRPIDAVLFDMDETLVNHHRQATDIVRELCEQFQDDLDGVDAPRFGKTLWQKANDLWQMMFDGVMSGDVARPYTFINTLRALRLNDEVGHEMLAFFERKLIEGTRLNPDTVGVLEALQSAGFRLGIVTNGYKAMQTKKIEYHGLHDRVDFVLVSEAVGLHKPHPGIFEIAVRKADAPAERVLFVGDNLNADIAGAAGAGLRAVLIDPDGSRESELKANPELARPAHVIRRLREVLPLAGLRDVSAVNE